MSRRPSRAANAQKRATRDARKERAAERVGSTSAQIAAAANERRQAANTSANARPIVHVDPKRERIWTALLVGGAAVAFGLLGRELVDAYADRARPTIQQNDLFSAVTSGAILVIIGVFAYRRWRLTRDGDPA